MLLHRLYKVVKGNYDNDKERSNKSERNREVAQWWFPTTSVKRDDCDEHLLGIGECCGVSNELFRTLKIKAKAEKVKGWKKNFGILAVKYNGRSQGRKNGGPVTIWYGLGTEEDPAWHTPADQISGKVKPTKRLRDYFKYELPKYHNFLAKNVRQEVNFASPNSNNMNVTTIILQNHVNFILLTTLPPIETNATSKSVR